MHPKRLRVLWASALAVALVAVACGDDDATSGPEPGASADAPAATLVNQPLDCDASPTPQELADWEVPKAKEKYKITLMQVSLAAEYYVAIDYGAKEAAKAAGVELTTYAGQGYTSPQVQLQQVATAIQQGTDAIVMAPSDVQGSVEVVKAAVAAGIPVVAISSEVASNDVYDVQQDDYTIGVDMAKKLIEIVGENGGEGIYSAGPQTATFAVKRENGFRAELSKHPGLKLVAATHTLVDPVAGTKALVDQLTRYPNVKWLAGGGYIIAPPTGLPDNVRGKIPYVTGQFESGTIPLLENGQLTAVYSVEPIPMGKVGVSRAVELLNGEEPPRTTCIPAPWFTKADIGTPLANAELIPPGYTP